jgi:cell pole-organizing protein PopZ
MSEGDGNRFDPTGVAEPSMEEILASIRRILTEEENERAAVQEDADDDILVLGSAMLAPSEEFQLGSAGTPALAVRSPLQVDPPAGQIEPELSPFTEAESHTKEEDMEDQVESPNGLVSAAAASEIANTVGSLVRSVSAERAVTVGRPGVTIEDLVREEIKPVLKAWLDSHLPSLVERVVRAEIGRVIDRMQS